MVRKRLALLVPPARLLARLDRRPLVKMVQGYLGGLHGLEIGASSHNDFKVDALNVDRYAGMDTVYKEAEREQWGWAKPVDVVAPGHELPLPRRQLRLRARLARDRAPPRPHRGPRGVAAGRAPLRRPGRARTATARSTGTARSRPWPSSSSRHRTGFTSDEDRHWSVWTAESFLELCEHLGLRRPGGPRPGHAQGHRLRRGAVRGGLDVPRRSGAAGERRRALARLSSLRLDPTGAGGPAAAAPAGAAAALARSDRVPWLRCLVLFLLGAALTASTIWWGINPHDEGLVLQSAARIADDGQLPYRDFYANYGPGQYVLNAGLHLVFGPSLVSWRVLRVLLDATVGVLAYVLARRDAPEPLALGRVARGRGRDGLAERRRARTRPPSRSAWARSSWPAAARSAPARWPASPSSSASTSAPPPCSAR